jgi:hypothetical protein
MGLGLVAIAGGAGLFAIPALTGVMAGAIMFGTGLPWVIVGAYTMLQIRTPYALQGRVSAAADTILSTPQVLSIGLGAYLVGIVDYRMLLYVMAGTVMGSAIYLLTRGEQWVRYVPAQAQLAEEQSPAAQ